MHDHKLNLLFATLLFGFGACADRETAGPLTDGMVTAMVDGQAKVWTSRVAANETSLHGLVVLYGSNDEGQGVRLTVPNEVGSYECADGVPREGGVMSVSILYVDAPGSAPALTGTSEPDCTIALNSVGDEAGGVWSGTFSGVLFKPDLSRIELLDGTLEVSARATLP